MTLDPFKQYSAGLEGPFSNALNIVPSDTEDLPVIPRAVWSKTGDLRMSFANGETVTIFAGSTAFGQEPFLHLRPVRIHATGTTATGIVIFW